MKNKYYNYRSLKVESNSQIKILQEKCFDLETKYSEKCEHLNNLEREIYLTRVCILLKATECFYNKFKIYFLEFS